MSYSELVGWMFNLERFGIKLGLDNMTEFSSRIGNPHQDFRSIHVTGTNGKGSVCAFTASILKEHGLKVGLYTSPHLVDFRERVKVNGRDMPERDVVRIGNDLRGVMLSMAEESPEKQLTFFEFTTGLAFRYFGEQKVDIAVVEVGMGGRLDATNIIVPEVAAITRIGLEHTNYLGHTIQEIAREKAGIIKDRARVVTCERAPEALQVISSTCDKKQAELRRIGNDFDISDVKQTLAGTAFDYKGSIAYQGLRTRLLGSHQAENAAAAIAIVEYLADSGIAANESEIRKGLRKTNWPGRMDIVSKSPLVIFDGSHNPDGISRTVSCFNELGITPLTYIIACMDDKDARGIVRALTPTAAKMIVTQAKYKRALAANKLEGIVKSIFTGPTIVFDDSNAALDHGIENLEGKGLCAIGSLYLVGEALQWWHDRRGKR
jgi:dihydrofolate synthase/folylpolyglutamate synthase